MMKKVLFVLLALAFSLSLVACASTDDNQEQTSVTPTASTTSTPTDDATSTPAPTATSEPIATIEPTAPPITQEIDNGLGEKAEADSGNIQNNSGDDEPAITTEPNPDIEVDPQGGETTGAEKNPDGGYEPDPSDGLEAYGCLLDFFNNDEIAPVSKEILIGTWKTTYNSINNCMTLYTSKADPASADYQAVMEDYAGVRDDLLDFSSIRLICMEDKAVLIQWDEIDESAYVGDEDVTAIYFAEYDTDVLLKYYPEYNILIIVDKEYDLLATYEKVSDSVEYLTYDEYGVIIELPSGYRNIESLSEINGTWIIDVDKLYQDTSEQYINEYGMEGYEEKFEEDFDELKEMISSMYIEVVDETCKITYDEEALDLSLTIDEDTSMSCLEDESGVAITTLYNPEEDKLVLISGSELNFYFTRK